VSRRTERETVADATAPLVVTNALARLVRRFGTERVLAAVKEWVAYIEKAKESGR
jgi:hypothetical protein